MDPATWLAAELDAPPTACAAAIRAKTHGRQVRDLLRYVKAIPLSEWEHAVHQHQPHRPTKTLAQCNADTCPGIRHDWTDARGANAFVCMGA